YVEPVYLHGASTNSNYPLLKKVLVTYGEKTAFRDTLSDALDEVFGGTGSQPPPSTSPGQPTQPSGNPTVAKALEDAQKAYDDSQKAMEQHDWSAYGKAQQDLADALRRAREAER